MTQAAVNESGPIVVLRSVNREGETFALETRSLDRLRATLGDAVRSHPRIFIAHETRADIDGVERSITSQIPRVGVRSFLSDPRREDT